VWPFLLYGDNGAPVERLNGRAAVKLALDEDWDNVVDVLLEWERLGRLQWIELGLKIDLDLTVAIAVD